MQCPEGGVAREREMRGNARRVRDKDGRRRVTSVLLSEDRSTVNILGHMTSDQSIRPMHKKREVARAMKTKQYSVRARVFCAMI